MRSIVTGSCASLQHLRALGEVRDHLTASELNPGFVFEGERIPLINRQRGIFKPQQLRFLLSIRTVFPKPGGKVWYDDQREVHRQILFVDWAGDTVPIVDPMTGEVRDHRNAVRNQSEHLSAIAGIRTCEFDAERRTTPP
jgi:hypothetical protein